MFSTIIPSLLLILLCGIIFLIICCLYYFISRIGYTGSEYQLNTEKKFWQVLFNKGAYGEYLTYKNLKKFSTTGRFLFNVYIPDGNGGTTEIDVLYIHQSGIYVFESKNYSGWIFGSETEKYWTQSLPGGGKTIKNRFYNPIMQNEGHIKWLKVLLADYPELIYHSCILFSDRCTLKNVINTENVNVINRYAVVKYIEDTAAKTGAILSQDQISTVYTKLKSYSNVNESVKQKHIDDIRQNNMAPQKLQAVPFDVLTSEIKICPKCGKTMVLRTAKKGANAGKRFWGCSGFPNCKYIEDLKYESLP